MVTPFAADAGAVVLQRAAAARCEPDVAYWAIPDSFLDRCGALTAELKRERGAWITAAALTHACDDAGTVLADFAPPRIALVLGCTFAGQLGMIDFAEEVRDQSARFVSPIHFPQTVGNYIAGALSRAYKIQGPNLTLSTGAGAGLEAISTACALLADGAADVALAGGTEVLSDALVRGLGGSTFGETSAGIWSEGACLYVLRPADRTSGNRPQAVIRDWRACSPSAKTSSPRCEPATPPEESYCVEHLVGRSLAAESAMRLAAAIQSPDGPPTRTITHVRDGNDVHTLVVEVPTRC